MFTTIVSSQDPYPKYSFPDFRLTCIKYLIFLSFLRLISNIYGYAWNAEDNHLYFFVFISVSNQHRFPGVHLVVCHCIPARTPVITGVPYIYHACINFRSHSYLDSCEFMKSYSSLLLTIMDSYSCYVSYYISLKCLKYLFNLLFPFKCKMIFRIINFSWNSANCSLNAEAACQKWQVTLSISCHIVHLFHT